MPERAHFLIVGVNRGGSDQDDLAAAERDAEAMSRALAELGNYSSETSRLLIGSGVTRESIGAELDRLHGLSCDLLFIYWAGHAEAKDGDVWFYLSETTGIDRRHREAFSLRQLVEAFSYARGVRDRVLVLDTCFSGKAAEVLQAVPHRESENICLLAACGTSQRAREDPDSHGFMTGLLLQELSARAREQPVVNLDGLFGKVVEKLKHKLQLAQRRSEGEPILLAVRTRPESRAPRPSSDPLEQALGYVVRAFRSYLNQKVVSGVELIYFLGYDVWDGCLVYDGMVQGSVEQQLLNFIRHHFLHRDRLRSKYEEILAEENLARGGASGGKQETRLGMAGICFHKALSTLRSGGLLNPTLQGLRYIGDLSHYNSEYPQLDRLLGLRSCLYIPLAEDMFPPHVKPAEGRPALSDFRRPRGCVLMAVNRQPYGLVPFAEEARRSHGELLAEMRQRASASKLDLKVFLDRPEARSDARLKELIQVGDEGISRHIRQDLTAWVGVEAGDQKREDFRHIEMRPFLSSIGGVYQQRAARRMSLREGIHPRFVKTAKKAIGHRPAADAPDLGERHLKLVEQISDEVTLRQPVDGPLAFAKFIREENGIGELIPREVARDAEVRDLALLLTRNYVVATVWRDLELAREALESHGAETPDQGRLLWTLRQELRRPWEKGGEESWSDYIARWQTFGRAEHPEHLSGPDGETVWKLAIDLLDDLLDDLRESRRTPFEIVNSALQELAPVGRYIEALSQLEGSFGGVAQQKAFDDLSHSLLVWILGLWVLGSQIRPADGGPPRETVKERVAEHIRLKFADSGIEPWHSEHLQDYLVLYWGLIAATHDIAIPVQRFETMFRRFFNEYFGQASLPESGGSLSFALTDIFDHPRFPIYKNAITSLYDNPVRDWLEAIFHHALTKSILHSTVGALILIRELEPYNRSTPPKPAAWQLVRPHLKLMAEKHRSSNPERGLRIPAYLAHAVAFSQLPDYRALWRRLTDRWEDEGHPEYLQDTADRFHVRFEDFPLSYLLALFEVILEPAYEEKPPSYVQLDSHTRLRCSAFFVSGIDVFEEDDDRTTLLIALRFWGDSLLEEMETAYASQYIQRIYGEYIRYQKRIREAPDSTKIPPPETITLRTYEILRVLERLEGLTECFQSSLWTIKIRFDNMSTGLLGKFFVYPDDMPRPPQAYVSMTAKPATDHRRL